MGRLRDELLRVSLLPRANGSVMEPESRLKIQEKVR